MSKRCPCRHERDGRLSRNRRVGQKRCARRLDDGFQNCIALADATDLGNADSDVQSRKPQPHLASHEGTELSETEIIPVRFVENILVA